MVQIESETLFFCLFLFQLKYLEVDLNGSPAQ